VIDEPSVSNRVADVPRRNVAPSPDTPSVSSRELLRVAGAVARVVDRAGEIACVPSKKPDSF